MLFRDGGTAGRLFFPLTSGLEAGYSREQEEAADMFALHLLYRRFGHVGGATDFFCRQQHDNSEGIMRVVQFWASHPEMGIRERRLEAEIEKEHIPVGDVEPLGPEILKLAQ